MKSDYLKIGQGTINSVRSTLEDNGISGKILYVSDKIVDGLYGESVKEQIESVGNVKEEYVDYNTISYAMSVAERVIATDINCIVTMGGGKVLDVSKYAAYISKKPLLSIPTAVSNDGVASPIAVLKRKDDKPKSLGCISPTMLLIDTEIVYKAPIELIKAGIGDTISNYMALQDWSFAVSRGQDKINGYAYLMSQTSLDVLMKTQYEEINPDFINVLANSLVLSGIAMSYAGSSRPVSGSEHLFSHALDYYAPKKNLHGIQVALGTIAVLKLIGHDYGDVLKYLNRFDIDINPKNLEIDEDTFVECMQNSVNMRTNRYTYLHEADLSRDNLVRIYNELLEEL